MEELSRYLFVAGALPYLLLGAAHAVKTPITPGQEKGLSPRDPALRTAMTNDTILLTRRTTVWRAWVGFNFSHSLGAVLFGVVVVLIGRDPVAFSAQAALFLPLAVIVAGLYLAIAARFWFRTPLVGIAWSAACFTASWALFLLRR